ncbi:VRR-NUC domain-containing protein [Lacrimispora sp. JR3]|uniref:VRR-NUC domain-containing protein n=1 Tax=Lacrimispora sinapis TaxID=3111456 RepID=UPI003749E456
MRESDIEKILTNEVRRLGGRAYKWVSPGNSGVPDRIVIFPGKPPVFVELKTDTGKLSALQSVQIKRLRDLGQTVEVVKGIDGLSQFFRDYGYDEVSKALDCKYEL